MNMFKQTNIQVGIITSLNFATSVKWSFLGIILFFYGIVLKNQILYIAENNNFKINSWDITLYLMNDMYVIVYFIVPFLLVTSTSVILNDFNYLTLIRLKNVRNWIFRSLVIFWKKIYFFYFLILFMSFYITIGVPYSQNWSQFSKSSNHHNVLNEISSIFTTPLLGLVFHLTILFLSLSLLHLFLTLVFVTFPNKNFILLISALIFFGGIVGFKLLPSEYAFLSPTTYFSLSKYLNSFKEPLTGLGTLLIISLVFFLYMLLIDLSKKSIVKSIKSLTPYLIFLLLCLTGIISTTISIEDNNGTILDILAISFQGTSSLAFTYSSFFYYSTVFFGLVYLITIKISKELEKMSYYKIIRFRNLEKWFWSWFIKILLGIFTFLLTILIMVTFIGAIRGVEIKFEALLFNAEANKIVFQFLINGFLQICFYTLLIFILIWTRKESAQGLILISIFMIVMLPGINQQGLLPVGLNSMVYLLDYSVYYLTFILLVSNIGSYLIIRYLFTKSLRI